jgi:hypothetical protein
MRASEYAPEAESDEPDTGVTAAYVPTRTSEWKTPTPSGAVPVVDRVVNPYVSDDGQPWIKKALAALALLCIIEAGAIAWLWTRSSDALTQEGELVVSSRPVGARVRLDDDDLGPTPLSVRLAPGTYTLKVQSGKAEPRVIVVQIRPGVQTAQYGGPRLG